MINVRLLGGTPAMDVRLRSAPAKSPPWISAIVVLIAAAAVALGLILAGFGLFAALRIAHTYGTSVERASAATSFAPNAWQRQPSGGGEVGPHGKRGRPRNRKHPKRTAGRECRSGRDRRGQRTKSNATDSGVRTGRRAACRVRRAGPRHGGRRRVHRQRRSRRGGDAGWRQPGGIATADQAASRGQAPCGSQTRSPCCPPLGVLGCRYQSVPADVRLSIASSPRSRQNSSALPGAWKYCAPKHLVARSRHRVRPRRH